MALARGVPGRYSQPMATAALAFLFLIVNVQFGCAAPPDGFADTVEKVRPAVVNVSAMRQAADQREELLLELPPQLRGTPFEELLRRFMLPYGGTNGDEAGPLPIAALGSGFLIDPSGYVVTNGHLIRGAESIQVTLADGRKFDARLVGRDDETDVALLKIQVEESLPYLIWGDSTTARVGDWVLVVGNPFGLGGSVTAGIISARGRDIQSGPFDDYLQVDASMNRGNSGGPLIDRNGRVIGINTAMFSPTGGSIGIGFAISASLARPIVHELRTRGRVERAWLGVNAQAVTKEIAEGLGLAAAQGALVNGMASDGPAARGGVRQGDVIRSINGQTIGEIRELARLMAAARPGSVVQLQIWRDGDEINRNVVLGHMPAEKEARAMPESSPRSATSRIDVLGLALVPLTRDQRQRIDLPQGVGGAGVAGVKRGTAAADAGIMPGDVITRVGGKPVADPNDVAEGVRDAARVGRRAILLLIQRRDIERYVAVPVPAGSSR